MDKYLTMVFTSVELIIAWKSGELGPQPLFSYKSYEETQAVLNLE
jgi:hypothetical protein